MKNTTYLIVLLLLFFSANLYASFLQPRVHGNDVKITNVHSQNKTVQNSYTVRSYISGKWYLVTYSCDGYIISIVEDDE